MTPTRHRGGDLRLNRPLIAIIFVLEIAIVIGYGFGTNYAPGIHSGTAPPTNTTAGLEDTYPMFQDIHVMIFIGFGFLMTFLKKYGFSAVGFTFFVAAFVMQLAILVVAFFEQLIADEGFHKIDLDVTSLIVGDFAAGSLLISFGALLGKVTSFQVIALSLVHICVYSINEAILVQKFGVLDVGGSMVIHAFGAYFGLSASWVLTTRRQRRLHDTDSTSNGSIYNSDLFAMIGTVFLWLFWPSFNGALASGGERHRVVINTVLSLCGSCVMAFLASGWLRRRYNMVDIQNATLAGGVAIGAVANFNIGPAGAVCMGMLCGLVSVVGYIYLTPLIKAKLSVDDTCGVHNLHGMPGVISAIASIVASAVATQSTYGSELTTFFNEEPKTQALNQLYSLLCTLAMALGGGALGGFAISFLPSLHSFYSDINEWDVEASELCGDDDTKPFLTKEHGNGLSHHSDNNTTTKSKSPSNDKQGNGNDSTHIEENFGFMKGASQQDELTVTPM